MQIIDGKKIREEILEEIKSQVAILPFKPVFSDVLVGDDVPSVKYVEMKAKVAERLGITFQNAYFPGDITTEKLVEEIKKLNNIENMCGIIVQLPLPVGIDERAVLDAIDPSLDVDCLGSVMSKKFYEGENTLVLPTVSACMHILESLGIDISSKNIVVLGQGNLVGKPMHALLMRKGFNSTALDSQTKNNSEKIKNADIIISGIGQRNFIKGDMIKRDVIIIDAGTSESGSGLVGDVDLESVASVAGYVSPVPGGVGPVTVAMLFKNVLQVAKNKALKINE